MVGTVYSAGQNIEGTIINHAQALQLNAMALAALGYISQWFVLSSSAAALFIAVVGFFTAQYYGSGQNTIVKRTVALKMQFALLIMTPFVILIAVIPQSMSSFFSHLGQYDGSFISQNGLVAPEYANAIAASYGRIAAFSYFLWCWNIVTYTSQRDLGDPLGGTYSVILTVVIHVSLNAGLIYGAHFGVESAGYSLIASRLINQIGLSLYGYFKKLPTGLNVFLLFKITPRLVKDVLMKWQYPLFGFVWTIALVLRNYWWYQYFPGDVSLNISSAATVLGIAGAVQSIFLVATDGIAPIIARYVGHNLGRGKEQEARKYAKWAISYGLLVSLTISLLLIPIAFLVPELTGVFRVSTYNLDSARYCILVVSLVYPAWFVLGAVKSIMSTGGKVGLISFVDCALGCIHAPLIILLGFINQKTGVFKEFGLAFLIFFFCDYLKVLPYFYVYRRFPWWQDITRKMDIPKIKRGR